MSDDVSRETSGAGAAPEEVRGAGAAPDGASALFPSERLGMVQAYADALATHGVVRGLIGPREVPRLWERHLLNCAALAELLPTGCSVGDLGSGAGLPGIVLALARPDVEVTLVEPLLRRTTFLEEVVANLGLDSVSVIRGRAETLHGKRTFDVVTSRAVAPLPRLLEWSMPLVSGSGAMVAMKGASAAREVVDARSVLHRLRCGEPEILTIGQDVREATTQVIRVSWAVRGEVGWRPATRLRTGPDRSTRRGRRQRT